MENANFPIRNNQKGFTLAELMFAAFILIVTFAGLLLSYLRCLELNEMAKNSSMAVSAVKTRMEQIRNTSFDQLIANYNNVTFTAANLNGIGVSYINSTDPDLYEVTVTFCWQQKNGKVVGEDQNLNGALNVGEDENANGILDSPVQAVTYIYKI